MEEISSWLRSQASRERRILLLEEALLSNRFRAYALYRLRYFFYRFGAESVIQAVRFLLLFYIFSQEEFIAVLLAHAGAGLVTSFWWGYLEVMRGRVRYLYRTGRPDLIPGEIGRWLSFSILLLAATFLAGGTWTAWQVLYIGQPFGPADLYILAILLQLGLWFVIRCYHSGLYAIRRIYRPLYAILAAEGAGFAAVLALWPLLGPWALPEAAIVSTAVAALITFHYTARAYRFFRFAPSRFLEIRRPRLPGGSAKEGLAAGLSYTAMHLDSLLVLALFAASGGVGGKSGMFVLFFLVSPAIRAGFDWARLFYFDLKRLEIKVFKNLRRRFETSVLRLALPLGLLFWACAGLTGTLVYQRNLGDFYWLTLPFFVSRSLLAAVQIQAFSERNYWKLLASASLFPVGFLLAGLPFTGERAKMVVLSLVTFAGFVLLKGWQWAEGGKVVENRGVLWPSEWLARVREIDSPVRISAVKVEEDAGEISQAGMRRPGEGNRWRRRRLAERIAAELSRSGEVTLSHPGRLVWFSRPGARAGIDQEWLARQGGGLLSPIEDTGVQGNGLAALETAQRLNILGDHLGDGRRDQNGPIDIAGIERLFAERFPSGIVYDPDEPAPESLDALPPKEKRLILHQAVAFAGDYQQTQRSSRFEVTALCVAGELRMIFIVNRRADARSRSGWRETVRRLSVEAAWGAQVIDDRIPR